MRAFGFVSVCDGGVRRFFDGAVLGRASVWSERRDSSQAAVARRRPRDSEGDKCSRVMLHRALKSAPRRPHDSDGDDCSRVTLHRALKSASRRAHGDHTLAEPVDSEDTRGGSALGWP